MPVTGESICNGLVRTALVPAEEVRTLRQRGLREAGVTAADAGMFGKWLAVRLLHPKG